MARRTQPPSSARLDAAANAAADAAAAPRRSTRSQSREPQPAVAPPDSRKSPVRSGNARKVAEMSATGPASRQPLSGEYRVIPSPSPISYLVILLVTYLILCFRYVLEGCVDMLRTRSKHHERTRRGRG